jgi:hypothetical protein
VITPSLSNASLPMENFTALKKLICSIISRKTSQFGKKFKRMENTETSQSKIVLNNLQNSTFRKWQKSLIWKMRRRKKYHLIISTTLIFLFRSYERNQPSRKIESL